MCKTHEVEVKIVATCSTSGARKLWVKGRDQERCVITSSECKALLGTSEPDAVVRLMAEVVKPRQVAQAVALVGDEYLRCGGCGKARPWDTTQHCAFCGIAMADATPLDWRNLRTDKGEPLVREE